MKEPHSNHGEYGVHEELRKERSMTQEQLADRWGKTKNYISRIENDASDIRLSTLQQIVRRFR